MTNAVASLEQAEVQQTEGLQRDLYLTFHLHGEDYGIATRYVTEIIGIQKITNVPDMPDFIKGIINLRGRVIPVMDVRIRFDLPERDYDERTCIIVVEVNELTTGLVVERVKEVVEIPAEQIEPVPNRSGEDSHIRGLGKKGEEVKILLDIESLICVVREVNSNVDQTGNESKK